MSDPILPSNPPAPLAEPRPRAVTWRSIFLGLIGVVLICGLTPYNDYAVANTFMVGNFLPISLVLILLVIVLLLNSSLLRWRPAFALREAELAVVTAMMLVACSLPSSGLMRYLPSMLVGIQINASDRPEYSDLLTKSVHLPRWLLPDYPEGATTPNEIASSDVYRSFASRSPDGSIPWLAWVRPLLVWGLFIAMLWGLMTFLCLLVRRQWVENERLAFPLATVYSALIEAPAPGRVINTLFCSYGFWIAAALVFGLHFFNGMHTYTPAVPEIPRGYDFRNILADPPLSHLMGDFKRNEIFFCVVGVTFFLQTKIAFSIWFFYVLLNVTQVLMGVNQVSFTGQMQTDQTFGGLLVMSGVILWIGREHWWMILRAMVGKRRDGETESRYLPYAFTGWGAVACFAGLIGWFMAVGVTFFGAIVITLSLLMVLMMTARIVAETGLVFVQINWPLYRAWFYPPLMGLPAMRTTEATFFFSGVMTGLFHDLRESFAAFFLTGLRVADSSAYERSHRWRTGFTFVVAIALALVVGYTTSAASMLWTEYNYATTVSPSSDSTINPYALQAVPNYQVLEPTNNYINGPREEERNVLAQIGIGGGIVALTSVLRLTLAWWPLHPIGFIVLYSYATSRIWFSVMLGWLAKVIIVRLGGGSLLKSGRNVFIGLVVGEAAAAAFWLVVSLVMNWAGYEYHRIILLPT